MTPYVYLHIILRTILVRPVQKVKWIFYTAARNPERGEVGTKNCFTHVALSYIAHYLWRLEDYNHKIVVTLASGIDRKLRQLNPQLYTYIFRPDLFIPSSDGTLFRIKRKQSKCNTQ